MGDRVRGKTACVTGAARGIGRAIALALVAEGAEVWGVDRHLPPSDRERIPEGLHAISLDLAHPDRAAALVARLPAVDILVNCAAHMIEGTIVEATRDEWQTVLSVNVDAAAALIQAYIPPMIAQGWGSIINISSVAPNYAAMPRAAAYSTSKAALIGLTKAVAIDAMGTGVRCNAICPGIVQTEAVSEAVSRAREPDKAMAAFVALQRGPLGEPEDIAHLAVYLASDESRFMTGSALVIDGGMSL